VRRVQRELGISAIFVTHDQEEAFELADRVGVMNAGRLLEVAPPADLYTRPATDFAATFIGTANLMVGHAAHDTIRIGPAELPAPVDRTEETRVGRVQVLFRPEDVALGTTAQDLRAPLLGEGIVEEIGFAGSFERLRIRLRGLAGVRSIAPAAGFGEEGVVVDALRPQHLSRTFPLRRGDPTWVGVRRIHTLAHPGLAFLLLHDGEPAHRPALELGAQLALRTFARVTLLACGGSYDRFLEDVEAARDWLGVALEGVETRTTTEAPFDAVAAEAGVRPFDLVVLPHDVGRGVEGIERVLRAGAHSVLLVPCACPVPSNVLVCVAVGEPGKKDIQFVARLVRHFGARATILTVLADEGDSERAATAERFLSAGVRSMSLLGVSAQTRLRSGSVAEEVLAEVADAGHDLLVIGAPLPDLRGELSLGPQTTRILTGSGKRPVLIVRSQ
jgi:hypothetical protein